MNSLRIWHMTKLGLFVFAVVELAIAYGLGSLAIDRGSLIWYILAFIFIVGFFQNLVKLMVKVFKKNA